MFEQTLITDGKTKRERAIAFALVLQAVGITGLALLPLLNTQPIGVGKRFLLLPPSMAKPQLAEIKPASASRSSRPSLRVVQIESLTRPFVAPTRIQALRQEDAPALSMAPSGYSGGYSGVMGDVLAAAGNTGDALAPVPPKPAPKTPHAPVRVSSGVTQSRLLSGPKPVYPRLALTARIAGSVRLQATISREGRIENLHVLSGHPLLNDAAMDAVRQWRYRPLLLNGDPVEVITEIDVNFSIN
jgi:protein TonB